MKDLEYVTENLNGVFEDAYHSLIRNLQRHGLSTDASWLYSPPHSGQFGNKLQIFLQTHLPTWFTWSISERKSQPNYYAKGKLPVKISLQIRVISSMILSVFSGATIVVPIVIMSFNSSRNKSLITVSAAVALFGFVLAAVVKASSESVFIATATYAAVLVVFVGASGTGSG